MYGGMRKVVGRYFIVEQIAQQPDRVVYLNSTRTHIIGQTLRCMMKSEKNVDFLDEF